jgi:succinate dehydrogenase / fumarate reductase, cytochrome b subunit
MNKRPISPHLQVYKPQLTSITSILHRISGAYLFLGVIILSWLIFAIVYNPECLQSMVISIFNSVFLKSLLKLALLFWTLALFYHLFNGIRHLFWDAGKGFDLKVAYFSGKIVIFLSLIFTFLCWFLVYDNYSKPKPIDYSEESMQEGEK